MQASIRSRGIKKLFIGLAAAIGVGILLYWLHLQGRAPNSLAMIALGAPIAIGLVGLLEIVMNRPFSEMEDWWNSLKGWQRGVLGLAVAVVAFAVLIAGMVAAGTLGII